MPRSQRRIPKLSCGLLEIRQTKGMSIALARHLNVTRQAISEWPAVPIERLIEVEKFTGIPRERLRPDIFEPRWGPPTAVPHDRSFLASDSPLEVLAEKLGAIRSND